MNAVTTVWVCVALTLGALVIDWLAVRAMAARARALFADPQTGRLST